MAFSNSLIAEEIFSYIPDIQTLTNLVLATHSFIAMPRNKILQMYNCKSELEKCQIRFIRALPGLPKGTQLDTLILLFLASERFKTLSSAQ